MELSAANHNAVVPGKLNQFAVCIEGSRQIFYNQVYQSVFIREL